MKAKQILLVVSLSGLMILGACSSNAPKNKKQDAAEQPSGIYYTCTMHPEVISDKPGDCPKCGMELVKKDRTMLDTTMTHH